MVFVQEWAPSGSSTDGDAARTGPATTAGNTLFLDVIIRQNTAPNFTVTDSAGNTGWQMVAQVAGSGTITTFMCPNAASITNVIVAADNAGVPAAVALSIGLTEHSGVGALVTAIDDVYVDGSIVGPLTVPAGGLVRVVGGCNSTTRTWTYGETGMTATHRGSLATAQMNLFRAEAYPSAGNVTGGWTLTAGASQSFDIMLMVFGEAGETVEPEHTATVSEVNAAVDWTPSAGTVLEALSDDDPLTYITSAETPSDQILDVDIAPMLAPDEGQSAVVTLRGIRTTAPTSTATATVYLYNGATLRASSSPQMITSTATNLAVTFPSASITTVNWLTLRVVVSVTATG